MKGDSLTTITPNGRSIILLNNLGCLMRLSCEPRVDWNPRKVNHYICDKHIWA